MEPKVCYSQIEFDVIFTHLALYNDGHVDHQRIKIDSDKPELVRNPCWITRVVEWIKDLFCCKGTRAERVATYMAKFFEKNKHYFNRVEYADTLLKLPILRHHRDQKGIAKIISSLIQSVNIQQVNREYQECVTRCQELEENAKAKAKATINLANAEGRSILADKQGEAEKLLADAKEASEKRKKEGEHSYKEWIESSKKLAIKEREQLFKEKKEELEKIRKDTEALQKVVESLEAEKKLLEKRTLTLKDHTFELRCKDGIIPSVRDGDVIGCEYFTNYLHFDESSLKQADSKENVDKKVEKATPNGSLEPEAVIPKRRWTELKDFTRKTVELFLKILSTDENSFQLVGTDAELIELLRLADYTCFNQESPIVKKLKTHYFQPERLNDGRDAVFMLTMLSTSYSPTLAQAFAEKIAKKLLINSKLPEFMNVTHENLIRIITQNEIDLNSDEVAAIVLRWAEIQAKKNATNPLEILFKKVPVDGKNISLADCIGTELLQPSFKENITDLRTKPYGVVTVTEGQQPTITWELQNIDKLIHAPNKEPVISKIVTVNQKRYRLVGTFSSENDGGLNICVETLDSQDPFKYDIELVDRTIGDEKIRKWEKGVLSSTVTAGIRRIQRLVATKMLSIQDFKCQVRLHLRND